MPTYYFTITTKPANALVKSCNFSELTKYLTKKSSDFDEFMAIIRKAKDIHGNSFTYTLIESSDLLSLFIPQINLPITLI